MAVTDIVRPRRIIALGAPDAGVLPLLKELTGSAPEPRTTGSTAGLAHSWRVETKYYRATLPIWTDEVADVEAWRADFTMDEAREVVDVVGAWVFCFRAPGSESDARRVEAALAAIADVVASGTYSDVVCVAVAMPPPTPLCDAAAAEACEDACVAHGFELVDAAATGTDECGDRVGVPRLAAALEALDWELPGSISDDADWELLGPSGGGDDDDNGLDGFAAEQSEVKRELSGLHDALCAERDDGDGEDETGVDELESVLRRVLAIKEQGEAMPEAERRRFAARAVRDALQTL